jgi:uncharacterized protein YndB with AHSA1/START domain
MTGDTTSYVAEIAIEAPPHVVFQYFVEPAKLMRWMGEKAELDPRPGGVFAVDIQGLLVRGQYTTVEPPRRLVFTWGSPGNPALPAGSTSVEVVLEARGDGTLVRLTHSGLPAAMRPQHAAGWQHYLGRLQLAAAGADPGSDTWAADSREPLNRRTP